MNKPRSEEYYLRQLESIDAIYRGHICFTQGIHSDTFVNAELILQNPVVLDDMVRGVILDLMIGEAKLSLKKLERCVIVTHKINARIMRHAALHMLGSGVEIVRIRERRTSIHFSKDQRAIISGKNVLLVDDFISFGGSLEKLYRAVLEARGTPLFAVAIWNRYNFTHRRIPVYALINKKLNHWRAAECPLCKKGEPLIDLSTTNVSW